MQREGEAQGRKVHLPKANAGSGACSVSSIRAQRAALQQRADLAHGLVHMHRVAHEVFKGLALRPVVGHDEGHALQRHHKHRQHRGALAVGGVAQGPAPGGARRGGEAVTGVRAAMLGLALGLGLGQLMGMSGRGQGVSFSWRLRRAIATNHSSSTEALGLALRQQ
jgi:hypothetical protein